MKFEFKRDNFKSQRGNYSRLLELNCSACNSFIAIYQKDGSGNLKRLYLDRILHPKKLVGLETKNLKEISVLKCRECKEDIGIPYVYKKENRKAFKLYQDVLTKKLRRLNDD